MGEKVLCVPTSIFKEVGYFEGFSANASKLLNNEKFLSSLTYIERSKAEDDSNYKQLIPYCLFESDFGKEKYYFTYKRGKSGGETRLHDLYSLGIGGHINECDGEPNNSYLTAMEREIKEEVALVGKFSNKVLGGIYDPSNKVGQVHLGICHLVRMGNECSIRPSEPSLVSSEWRSVSWVRKNLRYFENWSQIVAREVLLK